MKEKIFVLNPLKEEQIAFLVTQVENENCCKIIAIRSDNSKQYTSVTFNRFCKESRLHHQLTAPYAPQQFDDISSEHKDDIVARKNTNEESKLLRACLDEAS